LHQNHSLMDISKLYNSEHLKQLAQNSKAENSKFLKKLKAKKPKKLDELFLDQHEEKFDEIDCLKCANCCRDLGPRILDKDIERLAKHMRIKSMDFIERYLKIDEDRDYVFKEMPFISKDILTSR